MLRSDTPRVKIYNDYFEAFPRLTEGAKEWIQQPAPETTLKFSQWLLYRDNDHPTLRFSKQWYYFCDLYTETRNDIEKLESTDQRHECLTKYLGNNQDQARREHGNYR